jgi:ParB family chromosome partitioning protein
LRLAVACLVGGATNWAVRADRTPPHGPAVEASVATSAARAAFGDERAVIMAWIGDSGDHDGVGGIGGGEPQTARLFARLLGLTDEQVLKVLAVVTAETLVAGSGLAERLGELLEIDMRAHWQPDETFLDLLTDKDALTRIAAELGGSPPGKATGKELRGLIRRRWKGEGCQPAADWLPRYFEFPTRGYTDRPVAEARAAYDRLAGGWRPERAELKANVVPHIVAPAWTEDADESQANAVLDTTA